MAIILIRETGQPDRRFQLSRRETIIGRDEHSILLLPHTTVSRQHAKIIRQSKDCSEIENLSTKNALLINGTRILKQILRTKDTIQIGKYTLVYFGDDLSPMDQIFEGRSLDEFPIYARTANATKSDNTFSLSVAEAEKMLKKGSLTRNARVFSQNRQKKWTPGNKSISFGGSEEIPVEGWFTGGKVAEISWNGAAHSIERHSSLVKVMINGKKIAKSTQLQEGDQIQIGSTQFIYDLLF